ncbi:MAG TPA: hypothetical protein VJ124_07350 [Pyrinomonadaceae bacterium]|nr:hypothetical protein [Pyrinomonadaceae bacterium]
MRNKYQGHGLNLDIIKEVDYVWHGEPLQELIGENVATTGLLPVTSLNTYLT